MAFVHACPQRVVELSSRLEEPKVVQDCQSDADSEDVSSLVQEKFTRQHRLTTASQFKAVFDSSVRISSGTFVVLLKPNQDVDLSRLGLAIAKRFVERAVDRNLIRRYIRECFRKRYTRLPTMDIVFLLRKKPDDMGKQNLRNEIHDLWKRVEKRCNV